VGRFDTTVRGAVPGAEQVRVKGDVSPGRATQVTVTVRPGHSSMPVLGVRPQSELPTAKEGEFAERASPLHDTCTENSASPQLEVVENTVEGSDHR